MAKSLLARAMVIPEAEPVMLQTNLAAATRALALLLDNAQKFTLPPEANRGAEQTEKQANVLLRMTTDADRILFTVEDSGIGVPAAEAEHIFEEFVQLNEYYNGTGIGLTVARSLARRLGGDVYLDTSYTSGARFVIALPKQIRKQKFPSASLYVIINERIWLKGAFYGDMGIKTIPLISFFIEFILDSSTLYLTSTPCVV